jgi:hypothetical protein
MVKFSAAMIFGKGAAYSNPAVVTGNQRGRQMSSFKNPPVAQSTP